MKLGRRGSRVPGQRWSVGAHLLAITVTGMAAFSLVAGIVAARDFSDARRTAEADTAFQANLGANAVAEAIGRARIRIELRASDPRTLDQLQRAQTDPGLCTLDTGGLEPFEDPVLHLFDSAGVVLCSSSAHSTGLGASLADQAWFGLLEHSVEPVATGRFTDPTNGTSSAGFAGALRDEADRRVGGVALLFAPESAAAIMGRSFAGPRDVRFTLIDRDTRMILFSTEQPSLTGAAVKRETLDAVSRGVWRTGFDGSRRLYRAGDVTDTGWRLLASVTESAALREARTHLAQVALVGAVALVVTLLLGLWLNRRIAGPLRRLRRAVEQAGHDVGPAPVPVDGPTEIGQVVQAFNAMVEARVVSERRLKHHLMHDATTGLPNRLVFVDRVGQGLARAQRTHAQAAVLFVGVDRVSGVRTALGSEHGENALTIVAKRLPTVLRPADTVARFSGDVFAVFCEGIVSPEQAAVVANRIRDAVATPVVLGDAEATLTASIGIALSDDAATTEEMLRRAEQSMTVARVRGITTAFYQGAFRNRESERLRTEAQLRRALESNEIGLHYQPVVELRSGKVVALEALARWDDPARGQISPDEFISVAEESGLIVELGRRVMSQACRQAAAWHRRGHDVEMAVNVSARQLAAPDFPDDVRRILGSSRLAARHLRLEITESVLIGDAEAEQVIRRLRDIGVKLSVDDFGTGFSSLSYLRRFPIDQLKIDRAFIADLDPSSGATVLVKAIVDMAAALGIEVVAEGVETSEQAALLRQLGCNAAQGFLIAPPQTAARTESWLASEPPLPIGHRVVMN